MNSIRIYFNGIEQNLDDFNGTESISFSFRKQTTTGETGKSFAPEFDVRGDAFSYLYSNLITQPVPGLTSVDVTVFDTCCRNDDGSDRLLFTGEIKGSDVRWCETESGIESCSMTFTIIDNSADADALTCLKNLFPWDRKDKFDGSGLSDGIFAGRDPALLTYCVDVRPGFLQEIILIFGFLAIFVLYPIALIVGALVTVVNFLIFLFSLGQFGPISQVNFIDDALAVVTRLQQIIVGCGRKHVTPFVYSYLTNMCDICGLGLNSSVFDFGGDYYDSVRMDAAFRIGSRSTTTSAFNTFLANRPNINGVQFLDSFKQFNLNWRISNGVLYVERKDFEFGGLWFDESTLPNNAVIEKCFEPLDESPFAFAEYSYAKDGIDNTGDETNPDWTEESIDWNVPPNPIQSGLFSRTFTFSTAQFRNDSGRDGESALDKSLYKTLFPALNNFKGVMLMERGVCSLPRLLQIDPNSDPLDARVLRYQSIFPDLYDYNTDWWVKQSYTDGTGTNRDTLYNRFLFLDDPRTTGIKTRNYSITVNADCDLIRGINLDSFIRISQGGIVFEGSIENIDYNLTQNTITVTGKI